MDDDKNKKEIKTERQNNRQSFKNKMQIVVWVVVLGFIGYGIFWIASLPKYPQSQILSRTGIHVHSALSIIINGKKIEVPADIGITPTRHSPMHTHDASGTIHMEYSGIVKAKDLELKNFFDIWGKDFTKTDFMGNPIGGGGSIKMTVNGKDNSELGNYSMKDNDKIVITYKTLKVKNNK